MHIIYNKIKSIFALYQFKKKWRRCNSHNNTTAENLFPLGAVSVGAHSYGPISLLSYGLQGHLLEIGSFCSIADGVIFLAAGEHAVDCLMTFPVTAKFLGGPVTMSNGAIVLEDDVWVGMGATILSGVRIGKGAIIGARAVVAKNVPPFAVVVGNPGRVARFRFTEDIRNKLVNLDYTKITANDVRTYAELFSQVMTEKKAKELLRIVY